MAILIVVICLLLFLEVLEDLLLLFQKYLDTVVLDSQLGDLSVRIYISILCWLIYEVTNMAQEIKLILIILRLNIFKSWWDCSQRLLKKLRLHLHILEMVRNAELCCQKSLLLLLIKLQLKRILLLQLLLLIELLKSRRHTETSNWLYIRIHHLHLKRQTSLPLITNTLHLLILSKLNLLILLRYE